jgi:hypothetical protein
MLGVLTNVLLRVLKIGLLNRQINVLMNHIRVVLVVEDGRDAV